jgi:[protein-PII] uridylyltransferase
MDGATLTTSGGDRNRPGESLISGMARRRRILGAAMDDFLPITDEREVHSFLDQIPLRVDRERFTRFVLGFPHRYLQLTAPVETVAHFALFSTLAGRAVSSRLARDGEGWKLVVVAGDRSRLFSRIAGSLSFFGADIVAAEAFSNSEALVLDTFSVSDAGRRFEQPEEGRRFQAFLEKVLGGEVDLERELESLGGPVRARLELEWDDDAHPTATGLTVSGPDGFGLLHALTRVISDAGCSIEIAHVETRGGRIRDTFFLTSEGRKLAPEGRRSLGQALAGLAGAEAPSGPLTSPRGHE